MINFTITQDEEDPENTYILLILIQYKSNGLGTDAMIGASISKSEQTASNLQMWSDGGKDGTELLNIDMNLFVK